MQLRCRPKATNNNIPSTNNSLEIIQASDSNAERNSYVEPFIAKEIPTQNPLFLQGVLISKRELLPRTLSCKGVPTYNPSFLKGHSYPEPLIAKDLLPRILYV